MKRTVVLVVVCVFGLFVIVGFVGLITIMFAEVPFLAFITLLFVGVLGLSFPRLPEFLEKE